MHLTGERQADLAAGLGLSQTQISRKQAGTATWTLADVDNLSAHYGIPVGDLLVGVDRAIHCLRRPTPRPDARRRPAHHPPLTPGPPQYPASPRRPFSPTSTACGWSCGPCRGHTGFLSAREVKGHECCPQPHRTLDA
ncbi:helix-turn-helix domain-containing protein [Streptomyces microflavus]|uniref:helix-turn-helix domain-containing protein n=1 Tax=Streptomyces microflavus TaxID=1919 RepID=UPI00344E7F07